MADDYIGYELNKRVIDYAAGNAAQTVRDHLARLERIDQRLTEMKTAGANGTDVLVTVFGYTPAQAASLRQAVSPLAKLGRVARGADTVPTADNFLFWANKDLLAFE